jgi:predicted nuclease of restriction endonuclease-like (RecB) superfamily
MIVKHQDFDQLIDNVYQTHCQLQLNAKKVVNLNLTIRNWLVGYYIVEFEQNGEDQAKYGTNLIGELASKLKAKGLKGFSVSALKNHRTFYLLYPQISQSVISFLREKKSQSLTGELQKRLPTPIRGSLTTELHEEYLIPPETLLSQLSFTHFMELIKFDDPLERLFYEVETIKNNWSVRELERAINTALYVRTGLSKNKEAIISKFKNQKPAQSIDVIRDPYFLEFLGLEERSEYSESELEQAILDHLQKFLIELGTGFCFEARQKRITFDNTHYRIDLIFYHRILKSHILIDLLCCVQHNNSYVA